MALENQVTFAEVGNPKRVTQLTENTDAAGAYFLTEKVGESAAKKTSYATVESAVKSKVQSEYLQTLSVTPASDKTMSEKLVVGELKKRDDKIVQLEQKAATLIKKTSAEFDKGVFYINENGYVIDVKTGASFESYVISNSASNIKSITFKGAGGTNARAIFLCDKKGLVLYQADAAARDVFVDVSAYKECEIVYINNQIAVPATVSVEYKDYENTITLCENTSKSTVLNALEDGYVQSRDFARQVSLITVTSSQMEKGKCYIPVCNYIDSSSDLATFESYVISNTASNIKSITFKGAGGTNARAVILCDKNGLVLYQADAGVRDISVDVSAYNECQTVYINNQIAVPATVTIEYITFENVIAQTVHITEMSDIKNNVSAKHMTQSRLAAISAMTRKVKYLSIGNSYSINHLEFLSRMAQSAGYEIDVTIVYFPGCSLQRHWDNRDVPEKTWYKYTGASELTIIKENCTLKEILTSDKFDVISFHQASAFSTDANTFQPYLNDIISYCEQFAKTKFWATNISLVHSYANNYTVNGVNFGDSALRFAQIKEAYRLALKGVDFDFLNTYGQAIQDARSDSYFSTLAYSDNDAYNKQLCSDGTHLNKIGEYIASLVSFKTIFGYLYNASVDDVTFKAIAPDNCTSVVNVDALTAKCKDIVRFKV